MTRATKTFPNAAAADAFANTAAAGSGATAYKNADGTYTVSYDPSSTDQGSSAPTVGTTMLPTIEVTAVKPLPIPPIPPKSNTPTQPVVDDGGSAPTVKVATNTLPPSVAASYINTVNNSVYKPRVAVYINGAPLGTPLKVEYSLNNAYVADKYYVELSLASLDPAYQEAFWADGQGKQITITVGNEGGTFTPVIIGYVDETDTDWRTRILKLRGRDLSSGPLDTKSSEKYTNMTSSQIATIIATKYGLTPDITATTTLVGQFYIREHAQLTSAVTEHDLLTFLANQEGFNYWIKLNVLHFAPGDPPTNQVFGVVYKPGTSTQIATGNFMSLVTTRSETLAKDIKVTVLSWNAKSKKQIKATVTRARTKKSGTITKDTVGGSSSDEQGYVIHMPGLTQQQAQDYAAKKAKEFSSHERKIVVEMPVDFALNPRTQVALLGTNTAWDQSYFIDSLEFSASFADGFRMVIHAKNHSPQTQTIV